jgi:glycogen operon protein
MPVDLDRHPAPLDPAKLLGVNAGADVGESSPLGATVLPRGVNFSLFSRSASDVELLFFNRQDDPEPARIIPFDPVANLTYHYWNVFVPGVQPGQLYGYRVRGPFDPTNGMRFDSSKVVLDPYGRGVVVPGNYSREVARREGDNTAQAMKSVVVDPRRLRLGRR